MSREARAHLSALGAIVLLALVVGLVIWNPVGPPSTSTMPSATTMTTDLQVRSADNLFIDNDVLHIPDNAKAPGLRLAGAAWVATGEPPRSAHLHALRHSVSLLMARLSGYALWLLAGHSVWQPDSRIVRHRRLWGGLRARGLVVPVGRDIGEHLVESPQGIRYFGGLKLEPVLVDPVAAILESEPGSCLAAFKCQDESVVTSLVARGWIMPDFGPSTEMLAAVCSKDGVLFWLLGEFDDREAGCAALATPEVIEPLIR